MTQKRIGIVSDTHGSLPQEAFELLSGQWGAERLADAVQARYRVLFDGDRAVGFEDAPRGEELESVPCDLILHAGDIGVQSALDELGAIARTVAVLGNNDFTPYWCSDGDVPAFRALTFEGVGIAMMHIPSELRCALHGRPPTVLPAVDAAGCARAYAHPGGRPRWRCCRRLPWFAHALAPRQRPQCGARRYRRRARAERLYRAPSVSAGAGVQARLMVLRCITMAPARNGSQNTMAR